LPSGQILLLLLILRRHNSHAPVAFYTDSLLQSCKPVPVMLMGAVMGKVSWAKTSRRRKKGEKGDTSARSPDRFRLFFIST
jgi:hypothetical protein